MTPEQIALLEANIDKVVELEMLDGARFLASPLFVYTGEENPDVFVLPVERTGDGAYVTGKAGQSILLDDIAGVHLPG
jgi:hypothetical protein